MEHLLQELELKICEANTKMSLLEAQWHQCVYPENNKKRSIQQNGLCMPSTATISVPHDEQGVQKRRRRASNFDELARRFFTHNEQVSMTSVVGNGGNRKNAFCSNGCCSDTDGKQRLGQRNMVIRQAGTPNVTIGKWCYRCIAKSGIRTKRTVSGNDGRIGGGYICTNKGCIQEGVGAQIDEHGNVVAGSLTCGCHW